MKELLIQVLGISPRVDTSLRQRKTFIEKISSDISLLIGTNALQ